MSAFQKLGWIVAAGILGVLLASGFQTGLDKIGTIDLQTMVETSVAGKNNSATFDKMKAAREGILQFIDDNRVLTMDQANEVRTLTLKEAPTAAETSRLERVKADVVAQAKRNNELSTKPNLTPEERTLLQEYANRSAQMEQVMNAWINEFRDEMRQWAQDKRAETLKKAKESAQQVAKAQGYSLVFDQSVALYSPNDLTTEALQAMNATK